GVRRNKATHEIYRLGGTMKDNRPTLEVMQQGVKDYNWYRLGLGTDPEMFVRDRESLELIPAFTFLPEKQAAKPTPLGWDVFGVNKYDNFGKYINNGSKSTKFFWDGFQAEWSYKGENSSACSCLIYLVDQIRYSLIALDGLAKKVNPTA